MAEPGDLNEFSDDLAKQAARILIKMEMTRRGMSFRDLLQALESIGIHEDERNLRNKVARATFTAGFFLQCLYAMRVRRLDLEGINPSIDDITKSIRAMQTGDDQA
jgi:hypothetical protein